MTQKYTLKNQESDFGIVDNPIYYQILFFKVKALTNFGFNIRVNYVGQWEKISEFGKEQIYKVDYNGLKRYFIFDDQYSDIFVNIRIKNPNDEIRVSAKYNLDKDVDNFEMPSEYNCDFFGSSNKLLSSVLLKIPNVKNNNKQGQPVRILLNIEVIYDSSEEDEATIYLMVSPNINYYQRLETIPLTLYSSIGKLNAKDTTIFDINKLNTQDNVFQVELALCGGELSTMVNDEVTIFRNPDTEIKSNAKKSKKFLKLIRFVSIFLLFLNYYFKNKISSYAANLNYIKECDKIEGYLKLCSNQLIIMKKRKKYAHPKISIISPVYNRGRFLLRFIKSIQNQNFKEIEIILIDDCSNDNTKLLIKKYQKEDQRIILIQNKKNKGTFASRNIGSLISKGQFIMLPDPDDILEQNCLHYFYNLAKRNDYELIRFYIYTKKKNIFWLSCYSSSKYSNLSARIINLFILCF